MHIGDPVALACANVNKQREYGHFVRPRRSGSRPREGIPTYNRGATADLFLATGNTAAGRQIFKLISVLCMFLDLVRHFIAG